MKRTSIQNKPRVLIIDPDPVSQKAHVDYFQGKDFDLERCNGITETVDFFRSTSFDCILMDVNLPEMKGYEAVGLIKKRDPEAQIILTAAQNSKMLEARVRQEDIYYYYIKSFNSDELLLAVQGAIRKAQG